MFDTVLTFINNIRFQALVAVLFFPHEVLGIRVEQGTYDVGIKQRITTVLNQLLFLLAENDQKDFLLAHDVQFNALFDQPFSPLRKRHSLLLVVLDEFVLERPSFSSQFNHL